MQGHGGENKVDNRVKRPRYFLDIEPELRNRIKAVASLHGKTMRDWVTLMLERVWQFWER